MPDQSETLRATLTCAHRRAREERICARLEQVVCLVVKDTPSTFPPWTKLSGKCLYSNSSVWYCSPVPEQTPVVRICWCIHRNNREVEAHQQIWGKPCRIQSSSAITPLRTARITVDLHICSKVPALLALRAPFTEFSAIFSTFHFVVL